MLQTLFGRSERLEISYSHLLLSSINDEDDFDEGENSDQGECPNGTTSSMTLFNSGLFIKTENNS